MNERRAGPGHKKQTPPQGHAAAKSKGRQTADFLASNLTEIIKNHQFFCFQIRFVPIFPFKADFSTSRAAARDFFVTGL
ncbi:hypothetical protein [Candidatus Allofournierella excrementavium]|uniref:hypothetical protein n=1 Tax=Candidatus Allofournierella excrementavium TaxID=2838591 RepID=UPI00374EFFA2